MKDYVLKDAGNSSSDKNETVWAFDLGKETFAQMLKHINQNIHESCTLDALRDDLLPKLLSGKLYVPEVEQFEKAQA